MEKEPVILNPTAFFSAGEVVLYRDHRAVLVGAEIVEGKLYLLLNTGGSEPIKARPNEIKKINRSVAPAMGAVLFN